MFTNTGVDRIYMKIEGNFCKSLNTWYPYLDYERTLRFDLTCQWLVNREILSLICGILKYKIFKWNQHKKMYMKYFPQMEYKLFYYMLNIIISK